MLFRDAVQGPFLGRPNAGASGGADRIKPAAALDNQANAVHGGKDMEINSTFQDEISVPGTVLVLHSRGMSDWADRARAILVQSGWTEAELSRRTGLPLQRLYKQMRGNVENPGGDALTRIANALGAHEFWLRTGRGPRVSSVPLVGYISAGEEFYPIDDHLPGAGLEQVPLSFDVADPIAIRVRGSSMSPVYRHGDDLFCSRVRGIVMEEVVGRDCVVLTKDGAGYVKQLRRGPGRGFTLRSYNPAFADIEEAELEWAAPICFIRRAL